MVGRPNVGKSTLTNSLIGEKIAIMSDRPQTTRNKIMCIMNTDNAQIMFLDTPGIHKPQHKLGEYMVRTAESTLQEVDVVLFVVDATEKRGAGEDYILNLLQKVKTPVILVVNKIDKLTDKQKLFQIMEGYSKLYKFAAIVPVSALNDSEFPGLVQEITKHLPEGPAYFPEDMITDHPERFIVSEIIREKLLLYLKDEVPHGVAVEIESYEEEGRLTRIGAVIYCEKKSHKGIIIGKDGKKLKGIGKSAREEIEALIGTKVFLQLWVKVRENWRDSDFALSNFGYRDQK